MSTSFTLPRKRSAQDYIRSAAELQNDYLSLKHELVMNRKIYYPDSRIDDFLADLGWTRQQLYSFEEYDYDPKASEIREYALAVDVQIHTQCNSQNGSLSFSFDGAKRPQQSPVALRLPEYKTSKEMVMS